MDEEERRKAAETFAGVNVPEPPSPPAPQSAIDPVPILGDLLNHFEAMIQAHGEVTAQLLDLVERNDLMTSEMIEAREKMVGAYQRYWTFKRALVGRPKGGENEPG